MKFYKDMTAEEKIVNNKIEVVECYDSQGEDDGLAIKVNGTKGWGSAQWVMDDNNDEFYQVDSIFGSFTARNIDAVKDELVFRASHILKNLMA